MDAPFKAEDLSAPSKSLKLNKTEQLPSSPATWLESAAARLLLTHFGHAETLCELFSSLDCTRTRVEEVLVPQALHKIEATLAQEPHVLLVDLPDVVNCLSAVFACRDHVFRHRIGVGGVAVVWSQAFHIFSAPSSSCMSSDTLSFWLCVLSGANRNPTALLLLFVSLWSLW